MVIIIENLSKAVTWTGVGSVDKGFGLIFGLGYIVSVCLFSIFNWFYPYQIGVYQLRAISFEFINKSSEILIKFPSNEDFIDTKEKLKI